MTNSKNQNLSDIMANLELEDQNFEEEIQQNPFSVKTWRDYILYKAETGLPAKANLVAERAVKRLPGSFKLWALYLRLLVAQCAERCLSDPQFEAANNAFERSLCFLQKMPSVWALFLDFLVAQRRISRVRKTFGRALRALPITQHDAVWPVLLRFIRLRGVPEEVGKRLYRRYAQISPQCAEERVKFLKGAHCYDEAAVVLAGIVNDENYVSAKGTSKEKLWDEFCSLMCKNPKSVKSLNADAIIRSAIKKYNFEVGKLWTSLADYYLRILQFEKARDIYEEAIRAVSTVRDFEYVYNTYCQFFEIMIAAKFGAENAPGNDFDFAADHVDLLLARYEALQAQRPLLINSVLLRQNPHNVGYWLQRAAIFAKAAEPLRVLETYAAAIKTVDPQKCHGKPHMLWIRLARFYRDNSDGLENVRKTFEKAVKYPFRNMDHLATVWCEWAEIEIASKNYAKALEVVKLATNLPYKKKFLSERTGDPHASAQKRVHRSPKLWALYADLEESFGTFDTTCAVYEAALDLRVASVQLVLNFGDFLEKNEYFERAFSAYERGVALFKHPHSDSLWERYLGKFIERYGGEKMDRTREIFMGAIENRPSKEAKNLFLRYAQFEEKYGSAKATMAIYDNMAASLEGKDKYDAFLVYISKASETFGGIMTREIYQKAIKVLPDAFLPPMCMRFARLEIKLGEVDRARAIFHYAAKFADTRIFTDFWDNFEKLEADFGNIETYADMNRIKRSVDASFTNLIVPSLEQIAEGKSKSNPSPNTSNPPENLNPMALAEKQSTAHTKNTDEIDISSLGETPAPSMPPKSPELQPHKPSPKSDDKPSGALAKFRQKRRRAAKEGD